MSGAGRAIFSTASACRIWPPTVSRGSAPKSSSRDRRSATGSRAKPPPRWACRPGIKVGAGLIDAHAGAVGTLSAGFGGAPADPRRRLALILGTSACCMAVSDQPLFIDGVWGPYFSALTPGQWLTEGGQSAFGAAIDRSDAPASGFLRSFAALGRHAYEEMERDILARAGTLSRAALLAGDIHVLPDFMGNRSPLADANMRGALVGLDLRADRASLLELYVAALTGLAHGVAQIIRTLETGGYDFDMLVVSGGAGRSPLVRQIIADATGSGLARRRPASRCCSARPCWGRSPRENTIWDRRCRRCRVWRAKSRPQRGEIAAFHDRKRRAFDLMQGAESGIRAIMAA